MPADEKVLFTWAVQRDSLDSRNAALQAAGAKTQVSQSQQFIPGPPVDVLVGVWSVLSLGRFVYQVVQNERKRGVIMDTTGGKLEIREQPNIPAGVIIHVNAQESRVYDLREPQCSPDSVASLIKSAIGGGK